MSSNELSVFICLSWLIEMFVVPKRSVKCNYFKFVALITQDLWWRREIWCGRFPVVWIEVIV